MDELKPHVASRALEDFFVNDLSRTYIQFIRDRVQKDGKNRESALYCLNNALKHTILMMAPFTPFLAEHLHQQDRQLDKTLPESIFLVDWHEAHYKTNSELENSMEDAKQVIQLILADREKAGLGIRWPLSQATVKAEKPEKLERFEELIKSQTNVKKIKFEKGKLSLNLNKLLTPELEKEGYTREVTRRIQALRKKAGLKKQDKIILYIKSDYKLNEEEIKEQCGVKTFKILNTRFKDNFKVKNESFEIGLNVVNN